MVVLQVSLYVSRMITAVSSNSSSNQGKSLCLSVSLLSLLYIHCFGISKVLACPERSSRMKERTSKLNLPPAPVGQNLDPGPAEKHGLVPPGAEDSIYAFPHAEAQQQTLATHTMTIASQCYSVIENDEKYDAK